MKFLSLMFQFLLLGKIPIKTKLHIKDDDSIFGYDERYNKTEDYKEELFKIKELHYKKHLLNQLESSRISVYDKLKIIEDNDLIVKNPWQDIIDDYYDDKF